MENQIFHSLIDLFAIINRPDRDKKLIATSGVQLEEAAFRVLVGIGHLHATSVGDLADMMGRNYSSISRQIDKLEAAGLVRTFPAAHDSRVRMSELTERGMDIYLTIQRTREQLMRDAMRDWSLEDKSSLLQHLTRLTDAMRRAD
jgi:DNA-binding MarR family transcriptional regulator